MKHMQIQAVALTVLLLAGCGDDDAITPDSTAFHFPKHTMCIGCHQQMVDEGGRDVSIGTFWESTMMANAARDPYWLASVRRETLVNPALAEIIEDKCANCHTPKAHFGNTLVGRTTRLFDDGVLNPDHEQYTLAVDGVSCTVCHQIEPDNFGLPESFSGGYLIDPDLDRGERRIYGSLGTTEALAQRMTKTSGFVPVQSAHLTDAAMCGTCHTLFTPTVNAAGEVVGEFPEQTVFLEWQNSSFSPSVSCTVCHMPIAEGSVTLSIIGDTTGRAPFRRHDFVGANSYVPGLLDRYRDELGVEAPSSSFVDTANRAIRQLQERTATVDVSGSVNGGELALTVEVTSLTGHKLPTGFPSRRVWLHVVVTDDASQTLFESGAPQANGSIAGNDNDADPAVYEPHYDEITTAGQVQIYETILGDLDDNVTTVLLHAGGYLKDNRLLPLGFSASFDHPDIGVRGAAASDTSFSAGGDTVNYRIDVAGATGGLLVQVRLLYQSIAHRWAVNLADHDAPEINRFVGYYTAEPELPVEVTAAELALP